MFKITAQDKSYILANVKKISQQEAIDKHYFGPVWHGTEQERLKNIKEEGFKIFEGLPGEGLIRNGFTGKDSEKMPVHLMGFGIYFTTSKNVAKMYGRGSLKGAKMYYLNVPRLEQINYQSVNTFTKWWMEYGFDPMLSRQSFDNRVEQTRIMTENLKKKFDAIYYKGKTIGRSFDSNQIVVFDTDKIFEVDPSLAGETDIGAKVKNIDTGIVGVILNKRKSNLSNKDDVLKQMKFFEGRTDTYALDSYPRLKRLYESDTNDYQFYEIRWQKGGTDFNIYRTDFEPYKGRK